MGVARHHSLNLVPEQMAPEKRRSQGSRQIRKPLLYPLSYEGARRVGSIRRRSCGVKPSDACGVQWRPVLPRGGHLGREWAERPAVTSSCWARSGPSAESSPFLMAPGATCRHPLSRTCRLRAGETTRRRNSTSPDASACHRPRPIPKPCAAGSNPAGGTTTYLRQHDSGSRYTTRRTASLRGRSPGMSPRASLSRSADEDLSRRTPEGLLRPVTLRAP